MKYFLEKLCNIQYVHNVSFAPTKDILDDYKKKKISWDQYEKRFNDLLGQRNIEGNLMKDFSIESEVICLLCRLIGLELPRNRRNKNTNISMIPSFASGILRSGKVSRSTERCSNIIELGKYLRISYDKAMDIANIPGFPRAIFINEKPYPKA